VGYRRQARLFQNSRPALAASSAPFFPVAPPLSKDLCEFFWAIGIPIYQGYGLTETLSRPHQATTRKIGPAAQAAPSVTFRFASPMMAKSSPKALRHARLTSTLPMPSREVLSDDGWFNRRHRGYLTKTNYLFITGPPKKDLLKNSRRKICRPANPSKTP